MGLFTRLTGRESEEDQPCPRCGIPAPAASAECSACGWDMRESFHGQYVGSHIGEEGQSS